MPSDTPRDLTRTLLATLFLGALIYASVRILRPFIVPAIWATMIVVVTWPTMLKLQQRLWGRRALAVLVMSLILLLSIALPLTLAVGALALNADEIVEWVRSLTAVRLPTLPGWLADLPYVGPRLAEAWQQWAAAGMEGLLARLQPYTRDLTRWTLSRAGNAGFVILEFLLTLVLAAVMYAGGEHAASLARRFGRRLAGEHGEQSVALAARAIRGVALGVGVTALVQSLLGGLGLVIVGVPFAGLLTALMFVLCLAQIGPSPVLLGSVVWVFWSGATGWSIFLLVWAVVVSTMDNVLRPWLIQRGGADMPLLLVFAGVIGGLLAFGVVGIFVGPVVLAVAYTLLQAWIDYGPPA
ncbi:MAG: AI-2E family transporter YdiK [Pseudomonadota bacterium]